MPDFEIFWGEWVHIELKHELDRPSGTFFLSGGSLRPVVSYRKSVLKKKANHGHDDRHDDHHHDDVHHHHHVDEDDAEGDKVGLHEES